MLASCRAEADEDAGIFWIENIDTFKYCYPVADNLSKRKIRVHSSYYRKGGRDRMYCCQWNALICLCKNGRFLCMLHKLYYTQVDLDQENSHFIITET